MADLTMKEAAIRRIKCGSREEFIAALQKECLAREIRRYGEPPPPAAAGKNTEGET